MLSELEKFRRVNSCETKQDFLRVILEIAENGVIQGRTRSFDAKRMHDNAEKYFNDELYCEAITREFGLRQQAMYILYYKKLENI